MNDRTAYRKILTDCLTQESMPPSDETIRENKELTQDLLEEILLSDIRMYIDKTDVLANILSVVYDTDPNDKVAGIEQFFKQADAHDCAGVFAQDSALSEELKNKYIFELSEKIRYAKMQQESLRDTTSFNRHIEKVIGEMKDDFVVLYELSAAPEEIAPALEKFLEYTISVNTQSAWADFHELSRYAPFADHLKEIKSTLLHLFETSNMRPDALRYYIEQTDTDAIQSLRDILSETKTEEPERAKEIVEFAERMKLSV